MPPHPHPPKNPHPKPKQKNPNPKQTTKPYTQPPETTKTICNEGFTALYVFLVIFLRIGNLSNCCDKSSPGLRFGLLSGYSPCVFGSENIWDESFGDATFPFLFQLCMLWSWLASCYSHLCLLLLCFLSCSSKSDAWVKGLQALHISSVNSVNFWSLLP